MKLEFRRPYCSATLRRLGTLSKVNRVSPRISENDQKAKMANYDVCAERRSVKAAVKQAQL